VACDRRKPPLIEVDNVMYRITRGPAQYFENMVTINNVHISCFETLEEARDFADLINRALTFSKQCD
jgi:hypothetical protein